MATDTLTQTLRRLRSKASTDQHLAEALTFLADDDEGADDPFAAVSARVADRVETINRRRIRKRRSDLRARSLTTAEVVAFVEGISDRRAVDRRRHRGRLLGVKVGNALLHPLWQFDPERADTRAGLERVLAALDEVTPGGRSADALMTAPLPDLGGRSIADVFAEGDVDLAVRLVRMSGDQS